MEKNKSSNLLKTQEKWSWGISLLVTNYSVHRTVQKESEDIQQCLDLGDKETKICLKLLQTSSSY